MSDIFLALSSINSKPESFEPLHQLCLVFWLHLPSDELFQFRPNIFNWIGIRRFWWRPPPIHSIRVKESLDQSRGVFGVVVLDVTVIRAKTINEVKKSFLKDLCIERGSHYPIENTHACSSPDAYSSPDVHFDGMFSLQLIRRIFLIQ